MRKMVILAVAGALGLTACASAALPVASGGNDRSAAKNVSSGAPASPSPKSTQGKSGSHKAGSKKAKAPKPKSCGPIRGGTEGKIAQLVDVRVGTHDGYDRVVFEFAAPKGDGAKYFGLPPYELHSATPPIMEDPTGEPMSVDGSRFATVVFHGGSGVEFDDSEDGYTITYTGPKEFRPGYPALAEASQQGDFEATLSWVFGLDSASCWKVHELKGPVRLAIDFPHD
jgi:uncharacterized low-complexity protein